MESTEYQKIDIPLEMDSEFTVDKNGNVEITGVTYPNAEVKISWGIIGDSTTSDKSGKFKLKYKIHGKEDEKIKINASYQNNTVKQTVSRAG